MKSHRRSLAVVVCLALFALAPLGCSADEPLREGPIHVRLIWKGDAAREATLSWSTLTAGERHVAQYRAADGDEWKSLECQRSGRHQGKMNKGKRLYYHHARLTGLEPGTRYDVRCESDGKSTDAFYFVTAPAEDVPVAILFGGDSRSGTESRQAMNQMMANMMAEQSAAGRPPLLALAHGGDFMVDGRKLQQWSEWLDDHQLTTGPDGRLLPIIPTRGNHDIGPLIDEVFDFPLLDGNYYTTDLSPQVRLTTLNTEISTAGDQQKWLKRELEQNRRKYRWYVCQYHRPAFPAVKVPSIAYMSWVPLFEKHRVDLVCEADGHNIKRTSPILDNAIHPEGVVYIGEGGLGVGQRTPKTDRWYLKETATKNGVGHHVHLITFYPDRLDVRVMLLGGKTFDNFQLAPRKWDD
jgi:acid phosphatase type 7